MQLHGPLLVSYTPIEKDWLQARDGEGCGRQADQYAGTVHDTNPALLSLHRFKQGDHSGFRWPTFFLLSNFCGTALISGDQTFNLNALQHGMTSPGRADFYNTRNL